MTHTFLLTMLLLVAPAQQLPQATTPAVPPATTNDTKAGPVTLTGCLSATPGQTGDYTFTNDADGNRFRLTGTNVRKMAGQKVQVVEATAKKLTIRGGLYPSPNVAAQAGDIDPVTAAIAKQPASAGVSGTGGDLPELRVNRVSSAPGACQ